MEKDRFGGHKEKIENLKNEAMRWELEAERRSLNDNERGSWLEAVRNTKNSRSLPIFIRKSVGHYQIKGLVRRFDTNRDGKISKRELRVGLKSLGLRFAFFRSRHAVRYADTNGDGVISEDEINEVARYVSKWGISIT
ncbi:EF-hand domain pair containing protein [Tanacetum coccineum]